jgi:hypothetical protein
MRWRVCSLQGFAGLCLFDCVLGGLFLLLPFDYLDACVVEILAQLLHKYTLFITLIAEEVVFPLDFFLGGGECQVLIYRVHLAWLGVVAVERR